MADSTYFGTERQACDDPDDVGCAHELSVHGEGADGCSYIGTSGWCLCSFVPDRTGAAALLHDTLTDRILGQVEKLVTPTAGPSPVVNALGEQVYEKLQTIVSTKPGPSTEFRNDKLRCSALVKAGRVYRRCHRPPEFWRTVEWSTMQVMVCFAHYSSKELRLPL